MRASYRSVNILTSDQGVRFVSSGPGVGRSQHPHAGADFGGVLGEAVLAMAAGVVRGVYAQLADGRHIEVSPAPGQVARARSLPKLLPRFGAGLYLELVHPTIAAGHDYLHTLYAHLNTVEVRGGDEVFPGQTLGGMGHSGVFSGFVHTHLEVFEAPYDSASEARPCLNPLGFQRYTFAATAAGQPTNRPGAGVWEVTDWIVTPCFPRSGTNRGRVGVDRPLPASGGYARMPDGTAVVGTGPASPLTMVGQDDGGDRVSELVSR